MDGEVHRSQVTTGQKVVSGRGEREVVGKGAGESPGWSLRPDGPVSQGLSSIRGRTTGLPPFSVVSRKDHCCRRPVSDGEGGYCV